MKSDFGAHRGTTSLEVVRGVLTVEIGRHQNPADLAAHIAGMPSEEQVLAWEVLGDIVPNHVFCDVFAITADTNMQNGQALAPAF